MREMELVDPFYLDHPTTVIGRLDHHVETRNRRKPAGTSMAACVLPIRFARQRAKCPWFFRFISFTLLHRYALSYPCKFRKWSFSSSSYVSIIRSDISRNLQRFCCSQNVLLPRARLPDAISHSLRKFARRKVRSDRLEYGLRAGTTQANLVCVCRDIDIGTQVCGFSRN